MAVTAQDVVDYLTAAGLDVVWDETDVDNALAAESAAQGRVCRIPDMPEADLDVALLRRVARHLSMRKLPLGVVEGPEGAIRLGRNDPEISRLEAPFRKLVFG